MNRYKSIFKESKFKLEISLRDARKANDILRDNRLLKYKQIHSNTYEFKDEDNYEDAKEILSKHKIEFEEK